MSQSSDETEVPAEKDQEPSTADRVGQAVATLKASGDGGASWFFWIAVLSLVNTAILHCGGEGHFIVGLAITTIIDVIANAIGKEHPDQATIAMTIAIAFSVFVSVVVIAFGWLSRMRILWVFGIGMFLYLLDGLLYLLLGDFLSAAFHGYALYSMIQGFNAYRKLARVEEAARQVASVDVTETDA